MPSKNPTQRLRDIRENISIISEFLAGRDFEKFLRDRKTIYAVSRPLEIISEASRRLPEEVKSRHQEINWAAVAAAGNICRHEYETDDERILWHTVEHDLPLLMESIEKELE